MNRTPATGAEIASMSRGGWGSLPGAIVSESRIEISCAGCNLRHDLTAIQY